MLRLAKRLISGGKSQFGTALGDYQGVIAYSNSHTRFYSREQNFEQGLYTGVKYQCVEFVRRWLQLSKGMTFHNIPHAFDIYNLQYFERISDSEVVPVKSVKNSCETRPTQDSLLVWPKSKDTPYGHVAVITEVGDDYVKIAEQNLSNSVWTGNHSRRLPLVFKDNRYSVLDKENPIGWIPTDMGASFKPAHLNKTFSRVTLNITNNRPFLDMQKPYQKLFADYWGNNICKSDNLTASYYLFESHFADKITLATGELNQMCLVCTDIAMNNDGVLERFGLPKWILPKVKESWMKYKQGGNQTISGRFDIAVNGRRLKLIEFNSDSAGILVETAAIQDLWAKAVGCDVGRSSGEKFEELLISNSSKVFDGNVHIMVDNESEEAMISEYAKEVFGKAGVKAEIIVGKDFYEGGEGRFYDKHNQEIKKVWKTWSWETIIQEAEATVAESEKKLSRLMLNPDVFIVEPLWKLVTSNKALLTVMWETFPGHPYLLRTEWGFSGYFKDKKYVKKPIVGRCGENVQIVDKSGSKIAENQGKFGDRVFVYQELAEVEKHDGFYPIVGSWVVGSTPAGFGIREDTKEITDYYSPFACSRVS